MDGRGGTGQIVDFVHLDIEGRGDVVPDDLEVGIAHQMDDIALVSCEIVVEANDLVAFVQEAFAKMGTEESGSAGD